VFVWKYNIVEIADWAKTTTLLSIFNMQAKQVESDIWRWIIEFVEQNHRFYDYKFPPCPYARQARLKGLVDVQVYQQNPRQFVRDQIDNLVQHKDVNVRVLAFPYWMRWNYLLRWQITRRNRSLVKSDYYAQFGAAITTKSCYPGWFKNRPYFIVIINKVSDVIQAQAALERTDYYQNWTARHYHNVVTKRNRIFKGSK
jgi:hypothetical protein